MIIVTRNGLKSNDKHYSFAINAELILTVAGPNKEAARELAEAIYFQHLRGRGFELAETPPGATRATVLVDDSSSVDHINDD